jgi:hypothetical protein
MNRVRGEDEPDFERDPSSKLDKLDESKLAKIQRCKDQIDSKLVQVQTGESPNYDSKFRIHEDSSIN